MKCPSERFRADFAGPEDAADLLELLEEGSFPGALSFCHTRRPDALASLLGESPESRVMVTRDLHRGCLAMLGACAVHPVWLEGRPARLAYLHGLRVRSIQRGRVPVKPVAELLAGVLSGLDADKVLTSILEENESARRLLEHGHADLPVYRPCFRYRVHCLPAAERRVRRCSVHSRRAVAADMSRVRDFLELQGRRQGLFPCRPPVWTREDPGNARVPEPGDWILLEDVGGDLLGAGAIWDQRAWRQVILRGCSPTYRWLRRFNPLLPCFGHPAIPGLGEVVPLRTLSTWAVAGDDPVLFRDLLNQARAGWNGVLAVGLPDLHPLAGMLKSAGGASVLSRIYEVWPAGSESGPVPAPANPYLECGLL